MTCAEQSSGAPLLALHGIGKQFPGVRALDAVDLDLYGGEVHMLVGENGAGKSSLIKILYGAYRADSGRILHQGAPVEVRSPADARRLGIAVIFQEFSLVPFLDIAQNLFLGREPRGRIPGTIDRARLHADARRVLRLLGVDYDTRRLVHTLGVAQQQMVEIAKALSQNARTLVMDEPTAALSENECEHLFKVIRQLKAEGVAIAYISHRLREVFELGDRITVLRDGRLVKTLLPADTNPDELVELMVGRRIDASYAREYCGRPGEVALEVKDLATDTGIKGVDLVVRAGEIVGLSGLVGAGRSEVARAIFGADMPTRGEVRLFGARVAGGPGEARRHGVALIPENRKREGLALILSLRDNLLLAALFRLFPRTWFDSARATRVAQEMIERLRIATPSAARLVRYLSGGNQQKAVLGKWLNAGCRFFILDEPTRGIDVGAKAEIFALIDGLVKQGAAVLMISSELSEIVHVCDRAYVMREGRIAGELGRDSLSEANILRLAMHEA
ncbi:MAG: sugar ABC transporter ATP-binding protein [Betaproteobacteria bacterium]|nr:sugar ABC transporter ATP-binding protein [Betaproteobacteria bacterium]